MKYILTISILLIIIIALDSCNDSLGIEKNVLISTIDTTDDDTTGNDTIQKIPASIDSIKFREEFIYDGTPFPLPIDELVTFQEAFVDTSTHPVYVWLKMEIKNKIDDDLYHAYNRNKYTQSIRFAIDSLLGDGTHNLIGKPNSGYWSELCVRNIETADSTLYNGSDTEFSIEFVFDFTNHITVFVFAKIPNPAEPDNKVYIFGSLILKYPK